MKIILSRKAFDSGAGKVANPILDDGTLIPMPIPDKQSSIRYQDIVVGGENLGIVASDLTRGRTRRDHFAHLDPDLDPGAYPREAGWRPLFGQTDAAQSVLSRESVGPGDLFLFFGWFRRVTRIGGRLSYVPRSPDVHVIWGWMQVGEMVPVNGSPLPDWMSYHPHLVPGSRGSNNTLYVGQDKLELAGTTVDLPGAGVCGTYDDRRRLTKPGSSRSLWELPAWFAPTDTRPPLGYHSDPGRWQINGDRVELTSAARGQEFVLDTASYPEAIPWVADLLIGSSANGPRT
ncbi:hypothetical protein [Nocardioides cavernaquae]|uniref:Nucleotide modification associated domain-containing protein n=1 Tax=Nocardioides cavernaquae TaxID=2321396 RepID=A0A3A5HC05_9ACTN|nr:hypothetical protein [Nocardioides cavernaquae]RJS47428.1 hypothetical protein D4739_15200 [Nocardioides cavernaquae]